MFPHPHNLITIRAMERERALAEADRIRRHRGQDLRSNRAARRATGATKLPVLQRAARALSLLVG